MENKIETIIEDLKEDNTKTLSYYYQQGFEIGKEEATLKLINNMALSNINNETISKITEIPLETINELVD